MKLCMENFLISVRLLIALFLLLVYSDLSYPLSSIAAHNNATDYDALVCFKHQLLNQQQSSSSSSATLILTSWRNDTNKLFCSWEGVTCGSKHPDRVIALDLSSIGLTGPLPTCTSNLTFLRRLDLSNNSMCGEIPPSLSCLRHLQVLNLAVNFFQGAFPTNLSSELIALDLSRNNFSEYGRGAHSSSSGDVYSFGIILLEMLTGRRPIDDIFKDDLNLHNVVATTYPHRLTDIVDPKILVEEQQDADMSNVEEARRTYSRSIIECLHSIADVGLSCSATSPKQRLCMRDAAAKLHAIRATYLQSKEG